MGPWVLINGHWYNGTTGEENNDFLQDPTFTDTEVNITSITVIDGAGNVVEFIEDFDLDGVYVHGDADGVGGVDDDPTVDVVFDPVSGSGAGLIHNATVFNAGDDFTLEWTTEDPADLWKIENVDSNDGFDIGGFNLGEVQPTPDQQFDFSVQIIDYDGDVDGGTADPDAEFSVGIDGTSGFDNDTVL